MAAVAVQRVDLGALADHPRHAGALVGLEMTVVRGTEGLGHQHADVVPAQLRLFVAEQRAGEAVDLDDPPAPVDA